MAGRPPLRIGSHAKITRQYQGGGVWLARCRYRDSDGVTRIVQRVGPADEHDKHGTLAEDLLIEALTQRRPPVAGGAEVITPDTRVMALVANHLGRLAEDGRSPATLATLQFAADRLSKFLGGVRVREATTARVDAALRSMRTAHGPTMAKQSKTVLRGGLQLAVMANAMGSNPARDVDPIKPKAQPKGALSLTAEQLRALLLGVPGVRVLRGARPGRPDYLAGGPPGYVGRNCWHCSGPTSMPTLAGSRSPASWCGPRAMGCNVWPTPRRRQVYVRLRSPNSP